MRRESCPAEEVETTGGREAPEEDLSPGAERPENEWVREQVDQALNVVRDAVQQHGDAPHQVEPGRTRGSLLGAVSNTSISRLHDHNVNLS